MKLGRACLIGLSLSFVLIACILHHNNQQKAGALEECDPRAIENAAAALGWPSVNAYKKHLLTERGGQNPCTKGAGGTVKEHGGFFDYLSSFIFGDNQGSVRSPLSNQSLERSQSIHDDRQQVHAPVQRIYNEQQTDHHSGEDRLEGDVVQQPLASSVDEIRRAGEYSIQPIEAKARSTIPSSASGTIVQNKEEKKADKALQAFSKESPGSVTQAVNALQAEAKALGYVVEPAPSLALEAQKLGYVLVPEQTVKSSQDSAQISAKFVSSDSRRAAHGSSLASPGHLQQLQERDTMHDGNAHQAVVQAAIMRQSIKQVSPRVRLSGSDAKRLLEEHVVETAVRSHLAHESLVAGTLTLAICLHQL
jgi:hypothetical protein